MGAYLTIPGVVESQELHSAQREMDDKSFVITLDTDDVAMQLFRLAERGERIELAVLTLEPSLMLALDDVYVSNAAMSSQQSIFSCTLLAREVRFV
jgi:hypothetical protein